jgi:hypothetical protein
MKAMKFIDKPIQVWNRFWFEEISAYPIAALRVMLAFYVAIRFAAMAEQVPLFFSEQGVYVPLGIVDLAPSPLVAYCLYGLTLLFAIAVAVGFRTLVSSCALFVLVTYHYLLNLAATGCSFDRLLIVYLFLFCFQDTGVVWSLDAHARPAGRTTVRAWLTRLIAIHLVLFYIACGLHKALLPAWQTGEILRYTWSANWASPLALTFVRLDWPRSFYDLIARTTIVFELSAPLLFVRSIDLRFKFGGAQTRIYIPYVQAIYMAFGITFHIMVWAFMNLPQFMLCPMVYPLFMEPEKLRSFLERFVARISRPRTDAQEQSSQKAASSTP